MTKLLVLLLVFCLQAQKTTTVVKEYTPRELEVTPWPDTTTTIATTSMTKVDLFQEREIEHDQETDYMENYESTSNEFIQTGLSASDLEKLKDIQIRIASSDSNKPELNVTDYDYFNEIEFAECRNFTSGDDNVSHFPHRTEIGLQFALNMMTLASWLIVIIVYARQGERHEPRQKLITGIILAASSFYLIASLFAVTSAQIGLFSSSHRYTEYDESCLAYLFGSGFSTMKNVCGWMKIIGQGSVLVFVVLFVIELTNPVSSILRMSMVTVFALLLDCEGKDVEERDRRSLQGTEPDSGQCRPGTSKTTFSYFGRCSHCSGNHHQHRNVFYINRTQLASRS